MLTYDLINKNRSELSQTLSHGEGGFTLIEILVVISIISLLASIVLTSVNSARIKGRDAKRQADLKQIRTALEFYNQEKGHYPITECTGNEFGYLYWSCFDCVDPNTYNIGLCDVKDGPVTSPNITAGLASYMTKPKDPKPNPNDPASGYQYVSTDGKDFKLIAWNTPENMKNYNPVLLDPAYCTLPISSAGTCSAGSSGFAYPSAGFWTPGATNWP